VIIGVCVRRGPI